MDALTGASEDDKLQRDITARRVKLRQLTLKSNQMEDLLGKDSNNQEVKMRMKELNALLETFKELNQSVLQHLNKEEQNADQEQWFQPRLKRFQDFMQKVNVWCKDVEKRTEKSSEVDEITHLDSASNMSKQTARSARSGASSATSARLKEEATRAALEAQAAALRQKQALALKEAQLMAEKEELQIQTALAVSNAKIKVYENHEMSECDGMNDYYDDAAATTHKQKSVNIQKEPSLANVISTKPSFPPPGARPKVQRQHEPVTTHSAPLQSLDQRNELYDVMKRQTNITEMLVKNQQSAHLPQRDVPVFYGDPLEFRSFMKAFEHVVDSKTDNNVDKLFFLEQYTRGEPHDLVKSCQHMHPGRGYREAVRLLEDHYGNPLKIATSLMDKLFKWPQIKSEDAKGLHSLSLFLVSCSNALEDVDYMDELDNPANMRVVVSKLPYKMKEKWRSLAFDIKEKKRTRVRFVDLVAYVDKEAKMLNDPLFGDLQGAANERKTPVMVKMTKNVNPRGSSFATNVSLCDEDKKNENVQSKASTMCNNSAFSRPCLYCKKSHNMAECIRLAEKPHKEKLEILRRSGICFGCLMKGHLSKDCKRRLTCQVCSQKHPSLLHIHKNEYVSKQTNTGCQTDNTGRQQEVSSALVSLNHAATSPTGAGDDCILSVLPVYVKSKKGTKVVETYAFMDPGSTGTFCSDALAKQLNLHGKGTEIVLSTMNATKQVKGCLMRDLEVSGINEDKYVTLPRVFTQRSIPVGRKNIPLQEEVDKWPYLREVKLPHIDADVGLLIGNDVPKAFEPWKVINSQNDGPYAVKTILGWTVNGPIRRQDDDQQQNFTVNRISVHTIERMLVQQYNADFPERIEKVEMSVEDKRFMEKVSNSVELKEGHYYINLPTKESELRMPNNRDAAVQRALTLKKKLSRNQDFHKEYSDCITDILEKGYAVKVPETQLKRQDGKVWYIPHHGVYHPQKKKLRVVFDCAASYQGVSLNQKLLQGPDLTNTLIGVLTRFRQDKLAMMADIEAMYHQVRVPEEDTDLLRFLWWPEGDLTGEMAEYKMVVHLFGATSSASCANFALRKTAQDNIPKASPEVVKTVLNNFYVDDCLKAVNNEKEAVELKKNLTALCASGGFKLSKWTSNSRSLLQSIPESERAKEVKDLDLAEDTLPIERALGVLWCENSDSFKFRVNMKEKPLTRRGVLSVVSSIYDPLGFIAPVVLPAKIILQKLCKEKMSWDQEIPQHLLRDWSIWLNQLPQISGFQIARCIKPRDFGTIVTAQLNHFSDASESGYGTVSFLKLTNEKGLVHCAFMMGKARVAPLKQTTIPRMELTAAVMAVNIDKVMRKELEIELQDSAFWTDSTAVLKYIANEALRLKTFVANRIAVIKENTNVEQWNHVDTSENPADCASRGLTVEKFLANHTWTQGPSFLKNASRKRTEGHDCMKLSEDDLEVRKTMLVLSAVAKDPCAIGKLASHYSSWVKLKRAIAWILRAKDILILKSCKRKETVATCKPSLHQGPLTVEELNRAEMEIIQYCQRCSFQSEISALRRGEQVLKRKSPIYRLDPYLQDGVLRVGGRLHKAAMPETSKHPIILPKDLHATNLLLQDIHEKTGHSGRNFMLSRLRQQYWIPSANAAVRKILFRCVTCKKNHAKAQEQKMADLPMDRLLPDKPPFTNVGMDYFGPIEVKKGRTIVKRYGVLFTCLTTRALHIEVSHTLDTDSCINAIRRFMCRRGQVALIRSDNGTNLVGAERELRTAIQEMDQTKIQNILTQRGVQWIFNPPAGPHFGGIWERQVRLVKRILKSVLHEQTIDDECLQTVLCEVEAIINDRPITASSNDPSDVEALTPNHLLLLKKQPLLPPGLFSKEDCYSRRRWKQAQYLADLFWKRWVKEYLPNLQERQKWNKVKQNLQPGDIVLILDDSAPRNSWLLGRVLQTKMDAKGLVRQVLVRTRSSTLERPVHKLCLICENKD